VFTKVFPIGTDGENGQAIGCHARSISSGLLLGELPGLDFIEGICGNAGSALGILIVTADNNDVLSTPESQGENPGGRVAVGDRCLRDRPVPPRVPRVKNARNRSAGAKDDLLAGKQETTIARRERAFAAQGLWHVV